MARKLICYQGHAWTIDDSKQQRLSLPRCPVCQEPPGPGSQIGWEISALGCLAIGILLFVPMMLFALGLAIFRPVKLDNPNPLLWTTTIAQLAWFFLVFYWLARGPSDVKAFAAEIGFQYVDELPRQRIDWLPDWPIKRILFQPGQGLWGRFQGMSVLIVFARVRRPFTQSRNQPTMTLAAFSDQIPGLPDFEIEPVADRRRFWNKDLLELFRIRGKPPLDGEPFANHYRLTGCSPEALEPFLTPADRDLLARYPDWAIQARNGQLVIFQPWKTCPASGVPTLLGVTCRLRQMFLKGDLIK